MTRLIRRLLVVVLAVGAVLVPAAPPAAAHGTDPVLDGFVLRHLPAGLGTSTDFAYEYDDVTFTARVWESAAADGWRVDLDIEVLRGARLVDARALHDWFIAYQDRPPAQARYRAVHVHGRPGWASADEVFWLVRPGVAVAVLLDRGRWPRAELLRTARGVRPA
jgi:hypothetical protein